MPPSQSSTLLASQSTSKIKIPQIFLEEDGCGSGVLGVGWVREWWSGGLGSNMLHSCRVLSGLNESVLAVANTVSPVKNTEGKGTLIKLWLLESL